MDNIKIVTIDENEFQIRKLNAFKQFNIARKIAGCFSTAVSSKGDEQKTLEAFLQHIAEIPDEQANDLLLSLLDNVFVKESNGRGWSPLVVNKLLMFENFDIITLGQIAFEVLKFNLANFMERMPQLTQLIKKN